MPQSENFMHNLSPFQRRLLATAVALVAAVAIVSVLFGVFLLLQAFVSVFSGVLWPLAVAGILALILRPVVRLFEQRLKLSRVAAIILLYVLVVISLVGMLAYVLPLLFDQAVAFAKKGPEIWENLRTKAGAAFPQVQDFLVHQLGEQRLQSYANNLSDQASKLVTLVLPAARDLVSRVSMIFSIGTGLAIVPVYLFFFLQTDRDPTDDLDEQLEFLPERWRGDLMFLVREFASSMEAFFRGQILIGLIMGVLLAIGFSLAGLNFGLGLGLMIGALNVIPYFGTIVGLGTAIPIAYFQPGGGLELVGVALGVFVAVQLIEGYVLTPRIMGEQTGLHPLTIIIAIFFWGVALDGLLGMVLAIPLTAFFVVFWRLARRKYLAQWGIGASASAPPPPTSAPPPTPAE